jgi:DNA-binding response OmpR family regulator
LATGLSRYLWARGVRGKDTLSGNAKYYINDLAYKNYLYPGYGYGFGYLVENLIYLELCRAGFDVYVGTLRNREVDFVAKKADRIIYLQSTYQLSDESTVEREYSALEAIGDNFEKIVVSLDEIVLPLRGGIKHIQAWDLVLIAEDNQDLQNYIYELLKNDFKVARASNGKEALSMAQSLFPDIIISDILMPEMDGKELCKKLKNDITTSHIPVILLTALNSINDEIRGLDLGADSYISKPFNDELILAQIKNLLHSRESLRQLFKSEGDEWKQRFSPEDLDRKFLSKSIQVVKNNMENESFSAKEFAEEMSFSRAHLHRKLKALTNQSATEFIRRVRLKEAVELIKKGELMVSEIGYLVGFKSHTYFTKSFKKQYGLSPKEFKNRKLDQTPRKDSKLSG